jgi:DNA-binding beta-propeller fold protein YncE
MRKLTKPLRLARGLASFLAATAIAIALACQSGAASAQTQVATVGADGYTRAMWRGTDASINLWKLDPMLNFVGSHAYGPYAGWSPVALTMLGNNTYLLWRYTDGTANIWVLDANLNFITSRTFGPVGGWVHEGLGVDPYGNIRLVWKTPANQIAAWVINAALNVIGSSPVYGPYFGWTF